MPRKRSTHYDPFDEGHRSACRIEERSNVGQSVVTADLAAVDCKSCIDSPEYSAVALAKKMEPEELTSLTHDVLMLTEPKNHRTLDQILAWAQSERAEVAIWASVTVEWTGGQWRQAEEKVPS